MSTLLSLRNAISITIQDPIYSGPMLTTKINDCVTSIAGGIRMPNGQISPPLPDLFTTLTVGTATDAAFKTLGATYQRGVFSISDSSGNPIAPPDGGDYYAFMLFLKRCPEKDLSESGSIHHVAIKGSNLYYQGIPTTSVDLTVHCYRLPVDMSGDAKIPDGIPEHLQMRLIRHFVCKDIFGDNINNKLAGPKKAIYHNTEFLVAMQDLVDYIGIDAEPLYYGSNTDSIDAGICD